MLEAPAVICANRKSRVAPAINVSVIIAAYNEEEIIGGLLQNLRGLHTDEILVVDGGSEDRTVEIASQYARVVVSPRGRALQMNAGAAAASGDVLLFLHADVRLQAGALDAIRRHMSDSCCVGGNFNVRYDGEDWVARLFSAVNRWRSRCGVFYGDSGIFCRRDVFRRLGGYQPWPILEDYEFARRLRKLGRIALLRELIMVSDRRWRRGGLLSTLWSWFWIQGLYLAGFLLIAWRNFTEIFAKTRPHLISETGVSVRDN